MLFAALYSRFPFAAFMSGLVMSLAGNLLTGTWPVSQAPAAKIYCAIAFFVASACLAALHAQFAKIDGEIDALLAAGKGYASRADLLTDLLTARRARIVIIGIIAVCSVAVAAISFLGVGATGQVGSPNPANTVAPSTH